MADAGDTVTLHHELAYADVLPVTWQRLERPPDAGLAAHWTDRNLRLLQACAALEEHGVSSPGPEGGSALDELVGECAKRGQVDGSRACAQRRIDGVFGEPGLAGPCRHLQDAVESAREEAASHDLGLRRV